MLVFSAVALPIRLVGILERDILDGNYGLGFLAHGYRLRGFFKAEARSGVQPLTAVERHEHPIRVDETEEPCIHAGHAAGVGDYESELLVVRYRPAEAVAVLAVLVLILLAAVQYGGRVHHLLLLERDDLALAQDTVPFEHIEDVGVNVVVAVQAVERGHVAVILGIHVGDEFIVLDDRRAGVVIEGHAVAADMAAAGVVHARGLENVLLKELLKRRSGDLLDDLRQKIVAGVGILERLARRAVGLRLSL